MSFSVEILSVGNEILNGDVEDTNSYWLCRRFTHMGAFVRRVVQMRDDEATIVAALQAARDRETDLIVTTGGLGPTDDDLTLQAVAHAFGRDLLVNDEALAMVRECYRGLVEQGKVDSAEMTPTREKMARLPEGAQPLANAVGAAPGVLLRGEDTIVVSLPGVPAELKAIFDGPLQAALEGLFARAHYAEWDAWADCGDESVLAPLLGPLVGRHEPVYIKSRARQFGEDIRFEITLAARGDSPQEVEDLLRSAWGDLEASLAEAGIRVELERS